MLAWLGPVKSLAANLDYLLPITAHNLNGDQRNP